MTALRAGFAEGARTILPVLPAAATVALVAGVGCLWAVQFVFG